MRIAKIISAVRAARIFESGEIVTIEEEFSSGTYTIRGDDGETAYVLGDRIYIFPDDSPPRIAKSQSNSRIEPQSYSHLMRNMPINIVGLKNLSNR